MPSWILERLEIHCSSPLTVETIDGRPLGSRQVTFLTQELQMQTGILHSENIQFYILPTPHTPVILGLPWLCRHNLHISWKEGQITRWNDSCSHKCLAKVSPLSVQSITVSEEKPHDLNLPPEYIDLLVAFSKIKASKLPPYRVCDCAINLLPGTTPPKGGIFPLSQPESEAMKQYIEEELTKGFIRLLCHRCLLGSSLYRRKMEVFGQALITKV